jgi:galactose mutarotase-like enzyme
MPGNSTEQHNWVRIDSGQMSAEIDPHGAQLSSLKDHAARDLLWNGDPAVWTGRAPLLFPIVGALAGGSYRLGNQSFALPRHGFARGKYFTVESAAAASAVFKLRSDPSTLQVYPFRFELQVRFEVAARTLSVITTVRNLGIEDMPASFGYHPAFRWPLPFGATRSSHFIEFDADEPAPIRRLDAAGLVSPTRHTTPIQDRRLPLTDALFQDDVIILDQVASRGVSYGSENEPLLRIEFPDSPYLGIWTKPGAPFICIEPWHGIADPQGFSDDFTNKPGVFILAGGEELAAAMSVTLLETTPAAARDGPTKIA